MRTAVIPYYNKVIIRDDTMTGLRRKVIERCKRAASEGFGKGHSLARQNITTTNYVSIEWPYPMKINRLSAFLVVLSTSVLFGSGCSGGKPTLPGGSGGSPASAPCGAPGLRCCAGDSCGSSTSQTAECVGGLCRACGNVSQPCCSDNNCRSDLTSSRVLQCCRVPGDRFECRDNGAGGFCPPM